MHLIQFLQSSASSLYTRIDVTLTLMLICRGSCIGLIVIPCYSSFAVASIHLHHKSRWHCFALLNPLDAWCWSAFAHIMMCIRTLTSSHCLCCSGPFAMLQSGALASLCYASIGYLGVTIGPVMEGSVVLQLLWLLVRTLIVPTG